jgi:hypothetical protein
MTIVVKRRNVALLGQTEEGDAQMSMTGEGSPSGIPGAPAGITINVGERGEGQGVPPAANGSQQQQEEVFTRAQVEEMMGHVRAEEKDKLYPELEQLRGTVTTLAQDREARLAAEQEEQQRLEAEAEAERLKNLDLEQRLQDSNQTWEHRFAQLEDERKREQIIFQKEQELARLGQYRVQRIAEMRDEIAPQFDDLVRGNTTEEIEASLALMAQKTAEIVEGFQAAAGGTGQQQQQPRVGLPMSGMPPYDMAGLVDQQQVTFSNEELAAMSPEEYSRLRPQLLGAVSARAKEAGIYAP